MKIQKYISIARRTDRFKPKDYKLGPILGLSGEIGELLAELKKIIREPNRELKTDTFEEELGDILWYSVTLARRAKLDFRRDILFAGLKRLSNTPNIYAPILPSENKVRSPLGGALKKKGMAIVSTFESYQDNATRFLTKSKSLAPYLTNIWVVSGSLISGLNLKKASFTANERRIVSRVLGDVMWYVAAIAKFYRLDIKRVAIKNIKKILSAFPPVRGRKRSSLFDKGFPNNQEKFPRHFDVVFAPVPSDPDQAVMLVNGMRIGDPLKDNAYSPKSVATGSTRFARKREIDGYRFHDSIHLAFVAILGWSPVMRDLMQLKRKTRRDIDDAEDGARARIVEEMIAKMAHTKAVETHRNRLLDGEKGLSLDFLKQIETLAQGLEVAGSRKQEGLKGVDYWEWQDAILKGFQIYNMLRREKKGRVRVDMMNRRIKFFKLKKGEEIISPSSNSCLFR